MSYSVHCVCLCVFGWAKKICRQIRKQNSKKKFSSKERGIVNKKFNPKGKETMTLTNCWLVGINLFGSWPVRISLFGVV